MKFLHPLAWRTDLVLAWGKQVVYLETPGRPPDAATSHQKQKDAALDARFAKLNAAERELLTKEQEALTRAHEVKREAVKGEFTHMRAYLAKVAEEGFTDDEAAHFGKVSDAWYQQIDRMIAENPTAPVGYPELGNFEIQQVPQAKVEGRWLNDIATEYGMNVKDLITLNQKHAKGTGKPFHLTKHNNGRYYCDKTDAVYVKVAKDTFGETAPDARPARQAQVTDTQQKEALLRQQQAVEDLDAERKEMAELEDTREGLLSTDRRGGTRKEALRGTPLHKKDRIPLYEEVTRALVTCKNWDEFKANWKNIQGGQHIEDLFAQRLTFQSQGFHLAHYMAMLKTAKGGTLEFKDVMKATFPKGTAGEQLVMSIAAAQGTPLEANSGGRRFFHGLLDDVSGSFLNTYDRMLDRVKEKKAAGEDASQEEAIVAALETIYKDSAELYELTGDLTYKEGVADESQKETYNQLEGEDKTNFEGFSATLGTALGGNKFEKRTREAKGLRTKKDQITYKDVESSVSYTMAKEELFKYFSGEGAMAEIFNRFVTEDFNETGEIVRTFDAEAAERYVEGLFHAALLRNPELLEDKFGGDIDKAVADFKTHFAAGDLSNDEIAMFQEGYLMHMVQTHGKEVQAGREAQEQNETEREVMMIRFSDEFTAGVIEAYEAALGKKATPADRQAITKGLAVGIHAGFTQTIDEGATHTHRVFDSKGNLVDTKRTVTRKAGTNDSFQLTTLGAGIAPINVSGLGPNGRGHLSLGIGGSVNVIDRNVVGAGVAGRYQLELTGGGLALYVDAGFGGNPDANQWSPGVGGGIKIPMGVLNADLHSHVYVGGFEVGASLGVNTEKIYENKLDKKMGKAGFTKIDKMLDEGQDPKTIAEAILSNPEFAGLHLEKVAQTLDAALGLETSAVEDDPYFSQFVIDVYRARRSEYAAEILHGVSSKPWNSLSVGAGVVVEGASTRPEFQLGISVYSRPLTYRTPTGIPYENLSDARISQQLLSGTVDVTELILRGQVPQMQLDHEGEPAFVVSSGSIEGVLLGAQELSRFNGRLKDSGMFLRPTKIAQAGDEKIDERTLLELDIADVDGGLTIVPDPALRSKGALTYHVGENKNGENSFSTPDRYFLAIAPGTNLTIKRQTFHYPYLKNGSYEETVITISENPMVTRGQLAELERVPVLRRHKGQRTQMDDTHSDVMGGVMGGEEGSSVLSLESYMEETRDIPLAERNEWSRIQEQDNLAVEFIKKVGVVDYGETLDPKNQTKLTEAAKDLMDPTKTDAEHVKFRQTFKKISIEGSRYNPAELRTMCLEQGKKVLGRDLSEGELNHFLQTLTIYSFIDLHGEGTNEQLEAQKVAYEKMLKGFMRQSFIREFDKFYDYNYAVKMTDHVIATLQVNDPNEFKPEKGGTLPEGGVFASFVGSERIVGLRLNEGYRNQELYKLLKLTTFDLHSEDAIERDVAKVIVQLLNPMPAVTEMKPEKAEAVRGFLRDDFTLRMMLIWAYKDPAEHKALAELAGYANEKSITSLKAALSREPSPLELLTRFQEFVQKARATELSETAKRISLGNDLYISFRDVKTSVFVFQRCGNPSLYLSEKIVLENKMGEIIAVMDDSHKMVTPHGAEARLWVGVGVGVETERVRERTHSREKLPPTKDKDPKAHQDGTGDEDDGYDEGTGEDTEEEEEETWDDDDE